jgi:hypothetical protein
MIWLAVVLVGIAALIPFLSNYQGSGISQTPDLNSQNVVLELTEPSASTPTQVLPSLTPTQVIPTLEPSPTPCFPPAGWVPYVLTSVDDVGNLAQAVGLSLEDLQRANCGANLNTVLPGDAIFLPYIPTSTPDPLQLLTPTNTLVSIIIINTSTPTPTLTPVPTVAPPFVPPTATKPPKNNPPPSRPSPTPPESRP